MTSQWRQRQTRSTSRVASSSGYALPAVLMLSTALLIMGLAIAQSSLAIRQALLNQYYTHLASEAAQAGVIYAQDCITNNGGIAPWPTAPSPSLHVLTPYTDCTGTPLCTLPAAATPPIGIPQQCSYKQAYVISQGNIRTSYTVPAPDANGRLQVAGATNLLAANTSTIARTYGQTVAGVPIPIQITNIYGGQADTYVLGNNSQVYGFGNNNVGQLGNGNTNNQTVMTRFMLPNGVIAISLGTDVYQNSYNINSVSTAVVGSDDNLYSAGSNTYGQLGNGTTASSQSTPVRFQLPAGVRAISVTQAGGAIGVIGSDGQVYGAGSNVLGNLGNGTTGSSQSTPVRFQLPAGLTAKKLVAGNSAFYVFASNGQVYDVGYNRVGQLGIGMTGNQSIPVQFQLPYGVNAVDVVANALDDNGGTGSIAAYVLGTDGNVYAAGSNTYGQLGNGSSGGYTATPLTMNLPPGITATAIYGSSYSQQLCLLGTDSQVYCVGSNNYGQFGNGTTGSVASLTKFQLPTGLVARSFLALSDTNYVLASDGNLYGAGYGYDGQLGNGTTGYSAVAVRFGLSAGLTVTSLMQVGSFTMSVLASNGQYYGAGRNDYGQLGDGTTTSRSNPVQMQLVFGNALSIF